MATRKTTPASKRRAPARRAPRQNMNAKPEASTGFIDPNKPVDEAANEAIDIFMDDERSDIDDQVESALSEVFKDAPEFPLEEPSEPQEPTVDGDIDDETDDRRSYDADSYRDNPVHQSHHFAFETADLGPLHLQGLKIDQSKYEIRMIRCMDGGEPDVKNLSDAKANGYTPVPIDQLPADRRALSASGGQMGGVYRVKDAILMWRPKWIARKHVEIERQKAKERREAIVRQLQTNMPDGTRMHSPDFNFKGVTGREATGSIQQQLDGVADQLDEFDDAFKEATAQMRRQAEGGQSRRARR